MGILNLFKKQNRDNEIEIFIKKNCMTAMEYAIDFEKNFDYSENSIAALEEILDCYSNDISKYHPTENEIWNISIIFGSYLGETLLKNGLYKRGYRWGKEDGCDMPLLIKEGSWRSTPIEKVYKRLVNGNVDNVSAFYKVAMELT